MFLNLNIIQNETYKPFNYLFFLILIILIGCENEENIVLEQVVSLNKIETVINTPNKDEQRVLYRLINSSEKYTLWFNKLHNFSKKNKDIEFKLTSQQLSLLKELKNEIFYYYSVIDWCFVNCTF